MCNRNWLIVLLILLGAGLMMLKNRDKTPTATQTQENTQALPEQATTPETIAQPATPEAPESTNAATDLAPEAQAPVEENVAAATATTRINENGKPETVKEPAVATEAAPTKQAMPVSTPTETAKPEAPVQESAPTQTKAGSLQPTSPAAEQTTGEQRTVTVENAITKKMIGYRYFGTHYPTSFKITANGKEIKEEGKEFIKLANNQLTVRYSFEFLNGQRKGAKEITFAVKPKADNLTIGFDWKDSWRILIDKDKAEPISGKQIE